MTLPAPPEAPFKDYCLILQVHPEADAGMIEAAYWHLARRYNEQAETDPLAKENLDDLNEAYSVLGNPARHEEYSQLRNEVLGEGTLPKAAAPAREPPPLAVMEKQRPHSREAAPPPPPPERTFEFRFQRIIEPSWQNTLLVLVVLAVATSMLAISVNVAVMLTLLGVCMLIGAVPIIRLLSKAKAATNLMHKLERTTHLRHFDSERSR